MFECSAYVSFSSSGPRNRYLIVGPRTSAKPREAAVSGCCCHCSYFKQRESDRRFPCLARSSQEAQMPSGEGGRPGK